MAELFAVTLRDEIACVTREIGMRQTVFPRRVADRKMKQVQADREIACMQAVLARLQGIERAEAQ